MGRRVHQRFIAAMLVACTLETLVACTLATLVACTLTLAGCGPRVEITHDYDPGADFSNVHSFAWLGMQSSPAFSEFDVKRLSAVLKAELASKGLQEKTNGDVYVAAYLGVRPKADTEWEHSHGMYWTEQEISSPEGTLVVDIVDPQSSKPIWRSRATAMLQRNNSPQTKSRNMADVAAKLFAGFPPR